MLDISLEGGDDPNEDANKFLLPLELTHQKCRISMKGFCTNIDRQNINMHVIERNFKSMLAL